MIRRIWSRIAMKTLDARTKLYLRIQRLRLKNKDFSIISNNCIGGVVSHNLHAKFMSPTINLWMKPEDFLKFASDLMGYLNCEIHEVKEEGIPYPVGKMTLRSETVTVYFMHYSNFQEAVDKWRERAKRVNQNNLYLILEYPAVNDSIAKQEHIKEMFDELPYDHKVMLTKKGISGCDIINLPLYDSNYEPGLILKRKSDFSARRYLDDFDYVSFLNKV